MKASLSCLLFFLGLGILYAQPDPDPLHLKLQTLSEQHHLPGFGVAIVNSKGTCYAQAYGMASIEKRIPFRKETILNIGSLSKTYVGIALAKALEQGFLNLDEPINKYLSVKIKHPYYPQVPITLRQLATHTSGIVDREEAYAQAYVKQVLDSADFAPLLQEYLVKGGKTYSRKNFSKSKPGTVYAYSNIGSALAAYVIQSATNIPFAEYCRKHIFDPLQLQGTGWFFKDIDTTQHAALYDSELAPIPLYTLLTYPDGGLKTNLAALSHYLTEVIRGYQGTGSLLSAQFYSLLLQPQFREGFMPNNLPAKEPNIGLFWVHKKNGELGHTGSDPGITTFMFFDPETGMGRIFMTNTALEQEDQLQAFLKIWGLLGSYANQLSTPETLK